MTKSILVNVDRTLVGMDAIKATGLTIGYINQEVVATMPLAPSDTADIVHARLGYVTATNWQTQAEKHGEVLDPHAFLAFLKTLPKEDTSFYCNQWTLKDGSFGCVVSDVWDGSREVLVGRSDCDWGDYWVVPVRKPSKLGA